MRNGTSRGNSDEFPHGTGREATTTRHGRTPTRNAFGRGGEGKKENVYDGARRKTRTVRDESEHARPEHTGAFKRLDIARYKRRKKRDGHNVGNDRSLPSIFTPAFFRLRFPATSPPEPVEERNADRSPHGDGRPSPFFSFASISLTKSSFL